MWFSFFAEIGECRMHADYGALTVANGEAVSGNRNCYQGILFYFV